MPGMVEVSIVVPMLNETAVVDTFFERLVPVLEGITGNWEIVCVDDGSTDDTWAKLKAQYGETMPRTLNLVTGPSRSGDIEQTILMGAHGPKRLHIIVVDEP